MSSRPKATLHIPVRPSAGVREDRQRAVPVSLGKPSLRLRLEAYYRIIAPDQIANESEWRARYDQIWSKFGGSHEGEQKLALKLAKKYGANNVTLELASVASDKNNKNNTKGELPALQKKQHQQQQQQPEDWYQLTELERNSGIVDFTSDRFDPVAALRMPSLVERLNPAAKQAPILDRISQFQTYLPISDPQYRQRPIKRPSSQTAVSTSTTANSKSKTKPPFCFSSIAHLHEKGPLSVLNKAFIGRKRVRILIRYVNGIRGTLTGYLVAFDKHMNMILRDVDEVYSPRHVNKSSNNDNNDSLSNVDVEVLRRQQAFHQQQHQSVNGASSSWWTLRQRHMKSIMVRGDNVVLVYLAEEERSAWPANAKSPPHGTMYRSNSVKRDLPAEERIGSPGSLIYAASVQMAKKQKGRKKRDYSSIQDASRAG